MSESRRKQVTGGLIWTYAERLFAQLINILVTVILARLIAPSEYGIISIVNVFINIANAFVINGFGNSLIQKKDADDLDFSTVFYFSLAFSSIIYVFMFICSDLIASFYGMPVLTLVIRVMSLRLPIAAVNSVQQAYVSKKMEFKKFFFATLGGTIISAIIGITMAYKGFGIWSLVIQYLSNVFIDTTVLWFVSGWKPRLMYSSLRMKSLFSYGWRIMCVGVMTTFYSNFRNLIIGKKYSSADLAYSEKGEQFPNAIAGNINSSISKVLFPVLSDSQDDVSQLKRMVRRSIKVGCYVLFPILIGFAMVADLFVKIVLTEKWLPAVPFLKIMCILYALQPLQTSALQSIKALGKSSLYLKVDIIKKTVGLAVLFITVFCFDNVLIIIFGALVVELFSVLILIPVNRMLLQYSYFEQICDISHPIFTTLTMCVFIYLYGCINPFRDSVEFVIKILIGIGVYMGISIITKDENLYYIVNIVFRKDRGK